MQENTVFSCIGLGLLLNADRTGQRQLFWTIPAASSGLVPSGHQNLYLGRISFRHSGCDRPHRKAIAHTRLQPVGINVTGHVCIQIGDRLHIRTTQHVFENLITLNIACSRRIPG